MRLTQRRELTAAARRSARVVLLFLAGAWGVLCTSPASRGFAAQADLVRVQHIDLVHFSHTDYGFTDHPVVCRELQRRYLDIAVDGVLATCRKPAEGRFRSHRMCWRTVPAEAS